MGIRIIAGKKVNDGPNAGTAAVIYCSTSMVVYPFIFEGQEDAERFLEMNDYLKQLSEGQQWARYDDWIKGGRSRYHEWKRQRSVQAPHSGDPYDDLLEGIGG